MVRGVAEHGPELDQYIAQYSKNWNFARIPLTAAAIMRVAMYEILYMPEIPAAAAINDAVEIAKKYEKVVSFINGILGAFVRAEFPEQGRPKATSDQGGLNMAGVLEPDANSYTTSAAWFGGTGGDNTGKLLEVPQGALGLRQSEALFQHVKRLPAILEDLKAADLPRVLTAIGASTRPREVEGSYMPCFWRESPGEEAMASVLEVLFTPAPISRDMYRRGVVRGENGFTGSAAFGLASLRRHDRVTVRGARWRYGAGDLHRRDLGYFRRSA